MSRVAPFASPLRRVAALGAGLALTLTALLPPAAAAVDSTAAGGSLAEPTATSVTLVGSLQKELGCRGDWRPTCAQTALSRAAAPGTWEGTFAVPAGEWAFRIAIDGQRDGAVGIDGEDVPLILAHPARLTFVYHEGTGTIGLTSPDLAGERDAGDAQLVADAADLGPGDISYEVVVDRFYDGDPTNNDGGLGPDPLVSGYDPARPDFFQGGDLAGVTEKVDYIAGLGIDAILLAPIFAGDAVRQTSSGASAGYHGQWGTGLNRVDPRYGTEQDLAALAAAAGDRGMVVRLQWPADSAPEARAAVEQHWLGLGVDAMVDPALVDTAFRDEARAWARGAEPDYGSVWPGTGSAPGAGPDDVVLAPLSDAETGRLGAQLAGTDLPVARSEVAHSMLLLSRRDPVIRYGDEQGFTGGSATGSFETMFAAPSFADGSVLDGTARGTRDYFDPEAPVYRHIAAIAALRDAHPILGAGRGSMMGGHDGGGHVTYVFDPDSRRYVVVTLSSSSRDSSTYVNPPGWLTLERLLSAGPTGADDPAIDAEITGYKAWRHFVPTHGLQTGVAWQTTSQAPVDVFEPSVVVQRDADNGIVRPATTLPLSVRPYYFGPGVGPLPTPRSITYGVRPFGSGEWTPLGGSLARRTNPTFDEAAVRRGTLVEYRAVVRAGSGPDGLLDGETTAGASVLALAGVDLASDAGGDVVTIPGSHGSELGCTADWAVDCLQATLVPGTNTYVATFRLPAGEYEYRAAVGGTWRESYGALGKPDGPSITYAHPGGSITFVYDSATNVVRSSAEGPIYTLAGSWSTVYTYTTVFARGSMDRVLVDDDGDGIFTLTATFGMGLHVAVVDSPQLRVSVEDLHWGTPGAARFTTLAGSPVHFAYDPATDVLTATPADPGHFDPNEKLAYLVADDLVAYPKSLPPGPATDSPYRFSLHTSATGRLSLGFNELVNPPHPVYSQDGQAMVGAVDEEFPPELLAEHPQLADYLALHLETFENWGGPEGNWRERQLAILRDDRGNPAAFVGVALGMPPRAADPEPTPEPSEVPTPQPTVEPTPEPTEPPNVRLAAADPAVPDLAFELPVGTEVFTGDWDGDGVDTLAWREGNRFTFTSANEDGGGRTTSMWYGLPTDEAFVGDWDGDGRDTVGIRRKNVFHLIDHLDGGNATRTFALGTPGDGFVVGDFDGDGADTISLRRGNAVHVRHALGAGPADLVVHFGRPNEPLLAGDLDGDGIDSLVIRRGDQFHVRTSLTSGNADAVLTFGGSGDAPLVGRWTPGAPDTVGVVVR